MPRYANVDKLMGHAIKMDWSMLKWVNEVDIITYINPRVVERKKGKWIYEGIRGRFPACKCSICGSVENADWAAAPNGANFCPYCGSDMREETEDEEK